MNLWEEGSTKTFEDLIKVGSKTQPKLLFTTDIEDNQAETYTLHNLQPATAYRVLIITTIIDMKPQKQKFSASG